MKKRNLPYRILSAAMCFAMILQGGIVMPAFADGTSFTYRLNYSEDACIEENTHPIIIPESDIDAEYGPKTHSNFNSVVEGISITTGNTISEWGPEPYRIIGYTFDGWYTAENGTGTKIDKDTVITDEMLDSFYSLSLYGNWIEYNSPDITSNSVTFNARNANSEDIADEVILTDVNGNRIDFDSQVTDYYANIYGSAAYVNMSFEQYEPDAETTITVNGTDVTKTKEEYITGTGYWYNETTTETPVLEAHTVNTGKDIETDYMPLDFTSDEKEYNEICITVTLPNNNQKTYTFHIKRLRRELKVSYGNTPYGVIMGTSSDIYTDENKATLKASFDSTLKRGSAYYSSNAWNIYGDEGVEVKKGTALTGTQYINYDKDETAIVVFMGSSFTDPGVTLYDENGNEIALSSANPITRTINYETVPSLKLDDWNNATPRTYTTTLTGAEGENVIDILKNGNVKPGIYTIEYTYDDEIPMKATRNMIVLPKRGDLNMDNYVNALDALAYDNVPDDNIDLSHNLYKYRVLDINDSGTVDDADETYFSNRLSIRELYPSTYSVNEDVTQPSYTAPDSASDSKAQLYMDFLGTDSADIDSEADNTQELEKGNVLWIGYRFDNTANLNTSGNLDTITISVDYDSRYISPDALTTTALINKIQNANPELSVFDFTGSTNYKGAYSVDSSTAAYTWNTDNNTAQVKTLILELHLQEGENFQLTDGYFIKIPFKVETVPPADGRSVITTKLGANSFNMNIGGTDYMWDTSNSLAANSVTGNLMSVLEYMGDYVPCFTEEAPATPLADATYGSDISYSGLGFKATVEGDLPPGLTYTSATGTITGIPKEAGIFTFYVNGVKYSITVNKAELKVTANDAEKIYGGDNPALTFSYDETCLRNGDTIADAVQTAPTPVCEADETTPCQSNYPITFEEGSGESDNYYFTFVPGNLTITPKTINITSVKIPECSINATFPYTFSATASGSDVVSDDIINNDNIMISYNVTYNDTEATKAAGTQKSVTVSNISIISDEIGYESGKNYILADDTKLDLNTGEIVADSIKDFEITEYCQLAYTYGEPLDLDTGNIKITYDSGIEVNATFAQAQEKGITISYKNSGKETQNGDKLKVSDSGDYLILTFGTTTQWTNTISVSKKDLHITADNKVRYYGDENSACHTDGDTKTGFTYSFDNADFVYDETAETISGFIAPDFSCAAAADTEIDKEKGYTEAEIELSGGSADNYNIICANGTLTINKRPLTITEIISDVPALTAAYYMNNDGSYKAAPYKVEASAVAGTLADGETASMTVSNLYNGDPVKINYNAQYANYTVTDSVSVTVEGIEMDDTYGKSYNYTVASDSTTSADGGRVYERNIKEIEVTKSPTTDYTYGTPLDLDTGNIHIVYDSGQEYNITFKELANHPDLKLVYTNTTDEVINETHLQVSDSGNSMTLTADSIYDEVNAFLWTSEKFEIEPHELHVLADSLYTTYGEDITEYTSGYTYTYTESDFQYSETESSAVKTKPVIVCKEDDGTTDANQKTLAGVYTMRISGGEADNYKFVYTNGTLTIRQRPLIITTINDIWTLSSTDARANNLSKDYTIATDTDNTTLTFAENYGLLWDDYVRISYTASYSEDEAATQNDIDSAVVNISNIVLDRSYGSARNYYIQNVKTPQAGAIEGAKITAISIIADPTENSDGTVKEYSYGDTLDLSGGRYEITFDSGRVDSNVTLDELKDYGITATYTGTNDEVEDGVFVTIDYHNGKSITLTPPGDATADVTGSIKVNKRKMHVIVNDASYTYGDGPDDNTYTFAYDTNDLAPGENIVSAFGSLNSGYTPPVLSCAVDSKAPDAATGAGTYTDTITASGGESNNYEFVCNDENYDGTYGTLTINKRDLKITAINSGIPTLTAADAYANNYELPIKLDGTAVNNQLQIENLKNNDEIKIVYKAVYNSLDQADNEIVGIEDVDFAEDCASKNNYNLTAVPADSTGTILTRLMSGIKVNSDPDKMEYTYGEWFRLSGGSVDITYNSGYIEQGVTFDNLKNFGIEIHFVKTDEDGNEIIGDEVKPNTILTVPLHNGAKIKLTPAAGTQVTDDIEPAYSGEITVEKHIMRVVAEDQSITYGDSAPEYTWYYNISDLVNGDSLTSSRFADGKTDPYAACTSDGNPIDSTTAAGEYDIVPGGGSNENYKFEYVNGTLTVNKKDLKITEITDGVPILTSEIVYQNGGAAPIIIRNNAAEYTAQKQQMTLDGIINNDEIGITYSAVYNSIAAGDNVEVGITDVMLDTTHTSNNNYTITEAASTAIGGTILEEQITSVEITADPVLRDDNHQPIQYTYGDKLNLNRGAVTVTYDSGRTLENVKFNEITEKTDGKVTLVYTDDEESEAADNDVLYVSKHNGKSIKLKISSKANVTEPQTAAIAVNKAIITVTAQDEEKYYGDLNPEFKYVYSGFVNGDDENSENFRLNLTEPEISCSAAVKSPVGAYDIKLSGGSSANYSFAFEPATLTVNNRPLDIEAITGGIPALTSKIIYDEPQTVHKLSGTAINTAGQLKLGNLSLNDEIKITYTAIYTSVEEAHNILVSISDIVLDSEYGSGGNYVLRNTPSTSTGGNIYGPQISMVEIVTQPTLEYTYGDVLDLSAKGVRITYDSGLVISGIGFDELDSYGVDVTCTDNNGDTVPVEEVTVMTVPLYNGAVLTLTPSTTLNNIAPAVSKPITVNKKALDVNISDAASVYGEDPTSKFEFEYDAADFVYGETSDSHEFTDNLTEPEFVCKEKDGQTDVSEASDVGSYTIKLQNGASDNYRFVYHDGTLKITKRPIIINNITDGIPELTSAIIFADSGSAHKLDAAADNSQLEYSNVVNNDDIRIKYKAVYRSELANTSCDVDIEYVSMDDEYGRSYNYEIDTVNSIKTIKNGGVIHDKEITDVEITEQPQLEYIYGDTLDLSGGSVKITYDSGLVKENITFDELKDYGIKITYTGTWNTAASGDVLTVPAHNGKALTLTAETVYDIIPVNTDVISVSKRVLEYGDCTVNPIVYDGSTTETTGTIVFTNVQNGDNVTASANFAFEDYLAGENKIVNITDIVLDNAFTENYELPASEITASGTIEKAVFNPTISQSDAVLSKDNVLTITAPALDEIQTAGGAKYAYSIDGGVTWSDSNVFDNLPLGLECKVCVKLQETDNYSESQPSVPVVITTYLNRITLRDINDAEEVIAVVYTNNISAKNADELKEIIGETYYAIYINSNKTSITYPFEFTGDMEFYVSSKRVVIDGGSSSSRSSPKASPTPLPTLSPTPSPAPLTPTPEPTESTVPASTDIPNNLNKPYITGYQNEVRPSDPMTRAEVTKIVSVISGGFDNDKIYMSNYYDIDDSLWYYNYIGYASDNGWVNGYLDGCFYPENTITRAEFSAIIARYMEVEPEDGEMFSDTPEDLWSRGYITALARRGILKGYIDGSFHPEDDITRAEGITLINRMINLVPDKDVIDNIICPFVDLDKSHWAYYDIMAAACEY